MGQIPEETVGPGSPGKDLVTYNTVERGGEPVSREQIHTDTYEPLDDEDGNPIPNSDAAPAEW